MKKISLFFAAIVCMATVFSQTKEPDLRKAPTLGINFFLKDFNTPDVISSTSLATAIGTHKLAQLSNMKMGASIQYYKGLTNTIDFMGRLGGSFLDYPFTSASGVARVGRDAFLLEADANLNLKLLPDNYIAVPYLSVGLGASMYTGSYFAAYAPVGAGMQFNLGEGTFINLQVDYHVKITDLATYNFQYSIGITSPLH